MRDDPQSVRRYRGLRSSGFESGVSRVWGRGRRHVAAGLKAGLTVGLTVCGAGTRGYIVAGLNAGLTAYGAGAEGFIAAVLRVLKKVWCFAVTEDSAASVERWWLLRVERCNSRPLSARLSRQSLSRCSS